MLLQWWEGDKGGRPCSLGHLRRLSSIHAGLGVCWELDLMHFVGLSVGEGDIGVGGKRTITIRRIDVVLLRLSGIDGRW